MLILYSIWKQKLCTIHHQYRPGRCIVLSLIVMNKIQRKKLTLEKSSSSYLNHRSLIADFGILTNWTQFKTFLRSLLKFLTQFFFSEETSSKYTINNIFHILYKRIYTWYSRLKLFEWLIDWLMWGGWWSNSFYFQLWTRDLALL